MAGQVRIVQVDKAFGWWCWLCPAHLARREATGFQVKANDDPPHDDLSCDDCHFGEPTTIPTKGPNDAD